MIDNLTVARNFRVIPPTRAWDGNGRPRPVGYQWLNGGPLESSQKKNLSVRIYLPGRTVFFCFFVFEVKHTALLNHWHIITISP